MALGLSQCFHSVYHSNNIFVEWCIYFINANMRRIYSCKYTLSLYITVYQLGIKKKYTSQVEKL